MEKFCLKWNEFEANIRESFKILREEERLFDVTIATEDGQHIQAHKMVLSAGSHFFSDIFMKANHSNMLIYLKGISSAELEPVIDFLYNGEAFFSEEYLTIFLATAKELQIKGLRADSEGISENPTETQNSTHPNNRNNELQTEYENYRNLDEQEIFLDSLEELPDSFDNRQCNLVRNTYNKLAMVSDHEIDLKLDGMIEKHENLWRCKVCGKIAITKQLTQNHAETHIEGVSHACQICNKSFLTRYNLKHHIYNKHSE